MQGGFQRLHETRPGFGHQLHAILHQHPALLSQRLICGFGKAQHFPPAQHTQIPLRLQRLSHFLISAHRRHSKTNQSRFPCVTGYQFICHPLRCSRAHHIARGIPPLCQTRENELQILIHSGHGAHGAARILHRITLPQSNGWRHILHRLDRRAVHAVHELPHIGRKGFHIAPLPLGIQRTHGQRGLATAARPGHHRDAAQRNIHIHPLQVVLHRTPNVNLLIPLLRFHGIILNYLIPQHKHNLRLPAFCML